MRSSAAILECDEGVVGRRLKLADFRKAMSPLTVWSSRQA